MKNEFCKLGERVILEENEIRSFKKPKNIFVTSGKIWITVEGDHEDYIYGEGECFKIPDGKLAVIQALGKSSFWF